MRLLSLALSLIFSISQASASEISDLRAYIKQGITSCNDIEKIEGSDTQIRLYPPSYKAGGMLYEFDLKDLHFENLDAYEGDMVLVKCDTPSCISTYYIWEGKWAPFKPQNSFMLRCTDGFAVKLAKAMQRLADLAQ